MSDGRVLNVVDERDNIIGEATHEEIHLKGLLHREIHVWLYNKNGEIFFQMREKTRILFRGSSMLP